MHPSIYQGITRTESRVKIILFGRTSWTANESHKYIEHSYRYHNQQGKLSINFIRSQNGKKFNETQDTADFNNFVLIGENATRESNYLGNLTIYLPNLGIRNGNEKSCVQLIYFHPTIARPIESIIRHLKDKESPSIDDLNQRHSKWSRNIYLSLWRFSLINLWNWKVFPHVFRTVVNAYMYMKMKHELMWECQYGLCHYDINSYIILTTHWCFPRSHESSWHCLSSILLNTLRDIAMKWSIQKFYQNKTSKNIWQNNSVCYNPRKVLQITL